MKLFFVTIFVLTPLFSQASEKIECRFGKRYYDTAKQPDLISTFFLPVSPKEMEEYKYKLNENKLLLSIYWDEDFIYQSPGLVLNIILRKEGEPFNWILVPFRLKESKFSMIFTDTANGGGYYELNCFPPRNQSARSLTSGF